MDIATLGIKIDSTGVATASKDLDKLTGSAGATEKATVSAASGFSKLQAAVISASVSVMALGASWSKMKEYMEAGAKATQVESSFKIMAEAAGVSSEKMIASMKAATKETIDDSDLMLKAVKLMTLGYDTKQIEEFSSVVITASQIAGTTATQAYEKLADAIGNRMPRSLVAMGAVTKEQMKVVTAAIDAGADSTVLMSLAIANLKVKQEMLKGTNDEASISMQKMAARTNETTESIGKGLIIVVDAAHRAFQFLAATALAVVGGLYSLKAAVASFAGNQEKANEATLNANAAFGAMNELYKKSGEMIGTTTAATEKSSAVKVAAAKAEVDAQMAVLAGIAGEKKAKEDLAKVMDSLITVTAKYGEAQLAVATSGYEESLKAEEATIAQLKTGLDAYMVTLTSVYTTRIEGEKLIAEAIKNAGGKPEDRMKAELEAVKQEEKLNVERLAGWTKYYDTLRGLHAKAIEAQKTKEKELATLQDQAVKQRMNNEILVMGLKEKLLLAQGKLQTDESIYMMKRQILEQEWYAALKLTGESQITALEAVKSKFAGLTGEVTKSTTSFDLQTWKWVTNTETIVTAEQAIQTALTTVGAIQGQIAISQEALKTAKEAEIATNKTWISELETAMGIAKKQMDEYTEKINELSRAVAAMDREVAISVLDQASGPIQAIKLQLDQLQNKVVTVTVNQVAGGGASSYEYIPPPENTATGNVFNHGNVIPFARGGVFNRPTLFPMSKGMGLMGEAGPEAVMPLTRGKDGKLGVKASGGQVINFNPSINITGTNKSPEQLAREIVKPLEAELRKLQAVR